MFIISSFFIFPVFAEEYNETKISNILYLTLDKSPYVIKEKILLTSFDEIKIDRKVKISFVEDGNICFSPTICLEGKWLYKNGPANATLTFLNNIHFKIEKGETKFYYRVKDNVNNVLGGGEKTFNLKFDTFSRNYLYLEVKGGENAKYYEFAINIEATDSRTTEALKVLNPPTVKEDLFPKELIKDDVVIKTNYLEFSVNKIKEDSFFSKRQAGKIFIQVEGNGEAWYVNPVNNKRYFLGRPENAFEIMSKLSLGVKHKVIEEINSRFDGFLGVILLDVEDNGRAYYINPQTKKALYLGRPQDAFDVMRKSGVGITNENLRRIEIGEI